MKALFSIKPEFVNEIKNGRKKYEYRKRIFKNTDVSSIVVYESQPVSKVVGEFEIENILVDSPETIWEITKKYSGITKTAYDKYFENKNTAFAIQIRDFIEYDEPIVLKDYNQNLKTPPQSFCYISE